MTAATCGFWGTVKSMVPHHRWRLLSRGLYFDTLRCDGCGTVGVQERAGQAGRFGTRDAA